MNDLLLPAVQKSTQDLDPYYNLVSLHLKGDVSTGRNYNAFSDASSNNFRLTNNGDVRGTSFSPYNTSWSAYFDGTGDYLSYGSNAIFGFGTADFTVEAWVYIAASADFNIFTVGGGAAGSYGLYWVGSTSKFESVRYGDTAGSGRTTNTYGIGQWYHIAASRSGGTARLFINGNIDAGSTYAMGSVTATAAETGRTWQGSALNNGYISNLRVITGTALYTANFTPATTNLTSVANTSLLTCQSNRFIDASTNNFTITRNGDTRISSFAPFLDTDTTSGSGYFDGTGDNILTPSNTSFALGSDWTYELWFYPISQSGSGGIVGFTDNIDNLDYTLSSNSLIYYDGSTVTTWSGVNPVVGAWNHIAIVKSSGTIRAYVNGKQSTNTASGPTTSSARSVYIGSNRVGTSTTACYIADFRIVKGTAVYTANFTPPAQPLTAVANTQLLTLQERGAYNTVGFQDQSEYQHVITRNGNATQGTFSPFSQTGWGNYCSGDGNYLSLAPGAAFAFGTGDFTVECFSYVTGFPAVPSSIYLVDSRNSGQTGTWAFLTGADGTSPSRLDWFNGSTIVASASINLTANKWQHLVYTRLGTTFGLFIDGVRVATGTDNTNYSVSPTISYIASRFNVTGSLTGYISNLRIVKGSSVYSPSNTTLTVPTAPLTAISGTSLLTCQSNRFIDNSTNNFTITRNGSPTVVAFSPFNPTASWSAATYGGSGYFDGSGDYLNVADNAAFDFGSGDFTIECWAYTETFASQYNVLVCKWNTSYSFIFRITSSLVGLYINVGNPYTLQDYTASVTNTTGQWNHFCVTRSGSTLTFYKNGASIGTSSISATITNAASDLTVGVIGDLNANTYHKGYISGMRLIKGTAVYTGNFTPPTAPLTAITNTSLLLNYTNAGVIDSTGKNVIETVGNAGVVTTIKKFGTGSMYFDGTADGALIPHNDLLHLNGDFTIELWFYANAYGGMILNKGGGLNIAWASYELANNSDGVNFAGSSANTGYDIGSETGATGRIGTITLNTWNHLAVTRSGNVYRGFVNGVQGYTQTLSLTPYNSSPRGLAIGHNYATTWATTTPTAVINGYIADLRISRYARYTANFTPPTKALPTRGRVS